MAAVWVISVFLCRRMRWAIVREDRAEEKVLDDRKLIQDLCEVHFYHA
jgi:hypothetical protein